MSNFQAGCTFGHTGVFVASIGAVGSLDEFQQAFCSSAASNIRLLAPAGSGKTHSLLFRCAEVAKQQEGRRFLVLTFTKAARDELRSRLGDPKFASIASRIEVTTLNSWGWKRVRDRHHGPKLLSQKDRLFAVQNMLQPVWKKHAKIAAPMQSQPFATGKAILNLMDQLKNLAFDHTRHKDESTFNAHLTDLRQAGATRMMEAAARELEALGIIKQPDVELIYKGFFSFWRQATETIFNQSVFTLEDQKYVAYLDVNQLLAEGRFPSGGSKYSDVLVDEFQDVSPLDLSLVRDIAALHRANLTIVGDDDQAIFEWRGATPTYILCPDKWLGRTFDTFILERNYRCPKNLVKHSQRLIVHNKVRQPKRVEAVSGENAQIDIIRKPTFSDSIDNVVTEIENFVSRLGKDRRKIALVSRKKAQLIPYQVLLAQKQIPFCAAEDLQVFLSQAFEGLLAILAARAEAETRRMSSRVIDDIMDLCKLVKKYPLNKQDSSKLRAHLATARPRTSLEALTSLEAYRGSLKGDNAKGAMSASFAAAIRDIFQAETVSDTIDRIGLRFSGLAKDYGKAQEDIFFSDPPFFYLAQFAKRYDDDFESFVDDIQLAVDMLAQVPSDDDGPDEIWTRPVHLMTALRAKGKEFDTVVLLDVNDGIWPSKQAESAADKEQERRVFYVAMTRAKKRLICTVSGQIGNAPAVSSPFLAEAGLI